MRLQMRLILLIAFIAIRGTASGFGGLNKVVFIDSYSRDYERTNIEVDVIINQLLNNGIKIDFSVQYLSSEIFPDTTIWKDRMNLFLDQLHREKPDAIVLISDEAWTTFRSCNRIGLDSIPIVLISCRSNSLPLGKLQKKNLSLEDYVSTQSLLRSFNAVGELRDLKPQILFDMMDQLIPQRDSYLIITDNLYLGRLNRLIVERFLGESRPGIPVKYLSPNLMSTDELCGYLSKQDLKTATFFFEWNDPLSQVSSRFTKSKIEKSTRTPFFINTTELLTSNAHTGGIHFDIEEWGKRTSDIIEQVLFGTSPKDIQSNIIRPQKLFVNCEALQRFGISPNNVPNGVVLFNEPSRFFTQYKNTTMAIAILGALLLIIITILVVWNRKMHVLMVREKENLFELEQKNEDLRLTQELLVEALDKTKEIDKVKSSFLSNMSHEIRTPLNAIIGFSELLIETKDVDERKIYMETILKNNALLLKLINDVLDISRLDSGKVKFTESEYSLYELMCELHTNYEALVPPGISFDVLMPDTDLILRIDRSRLYQILSNFISNACKFTLKGYIQLDFKCDDNSINLSVKDTGIGISPDKLSSVFNRFEKINGYDQGVGLGLSIALSIAEHMGGTITVESIALSGSTFTLKLPIERLVCKSELKIPIFYAKSIVPELTESTTTESITTFGSIALEKDNLNFISANLLTAGSERELTDRNMPKMHILYAEDNDSNFLLMDRILSDKFKLTRARNGQEAIDRFVDGEYQVVLMDLLMPVVGGIEATRQIRTINEKIPIIAVSASVFETDVQEAMNAGCNAFLPKPVNIQRLTETLRNIEKSQTDQSL